MDAPAVPFRPRIRIAISRSVGAPASERFFRFRFLPGLLTGHKFNDGMTFIGGPRQTGKPHLTEFERVDHKPPPHRPEDTQLRPAHRAAGSPRLRPRCRVYR